MDRSLLYINHATCGDEGAQQGHPVEGEHGVKARA